MSHTEKSKPVERPQRTPEWRLAAGITLGVLPACAVLVLGVLMMASQVELGVWLGAAGVAILVGMFLTIGTDSERTDLWEYVDHLEKSKADTEAALKAMDKETLDYRVAVRAAQIRASQTITDRMAAEIGGDVPPEKHNY